MTSSIPITNNLNTDQSMGPSQVPLRIRVDLGVITMKKYNTLPRTGSPPSDKM